MSLSTSASHIIFTLKLFPKIVLHVQIIAMYCILLIRLFPVSQLDSKNCHTKTILSSLMKLLIFTRLL